MKTIQLGQESSTLYTIENKISEAKKTHSILNGLSKVI